MAIFRELHPSFRLTVFRFVGEIELDDNVDAIMDYVQSDEFAPEHNVFADLSQSLYSETTFDTLRQLSYRLRGYYTARSPDSITVFYAPDDVHFGVARQYEVATKPHDKRKMGIFRHLQDCAHFLELDAADRDVMACLRFPDMPLAASRD